MLAQKTKSFITNYKSFPKWHFWVWQLDEKISWKNNNKKACDERDLVHLIVVFPYFNTKSNKKFVVFFVHFWESLSYITCRVFNLNAEFQRCIYLNFQVDKRLLWYNEDATRALTYQDNKLRAMKDISSIKTVQQCL